VKNATHAELHQKAHELVSLTFLTKDQEEAVRLEALRSFTRKDKESLSSLATKYKLQ
jgi:hypothetical protein